MMCPKYFSLTILIAWCSIANLQAQLGFCGGNSGDPIFTEDFGSGTIDGPALRPEPQTTDPILFLAPQTTLIGFRYKITHLVTAMENLL